MRNYTIFTKSMYIYLTWSLFKKMYGTIEWVKAESKQIGILIKEAKNKLTDEEIKITENRALQLHNEYEELMLNKFKSDYWQESTDNNDDYDYIRPVIDYNGEFYGIWKSAVAKRQSVRLKYDSTTSGVSDRLVDPYKSNAPYGEGYCHNRKEVRKFRFDRVIEIKMTDIKFEKPKSGF